MLCINNLNECDSVCVSSLVYGIRHSACRRFRSCLRCRHHRQCTTTDIFVIVIIIGAVLNKYMSAHIDFPPTDTQPTLALCVCVVWLKSSFPSPVSESTACIVQVFASYITLYIMLHSPRNHVFCSTNQGNALQMLHTLKTSQTYGWLNGEHCTGVFIVCVCLVYFAVCVSSAHSCWQPRSCALSPVCCVVAVASERESLLSNTYFFFERHYHN